MKRLIKFFNVFLCGFCISLVYSLIWVYQNGSPAYGNSLINFRVIPQLFSKDGEDVAYEFRENYDSMEMHDLCQYRHMEHPNIIYNRVPKTGSTTVLKILQSLSSRDGLFKVRVPNLNVDQANLGLMKNPNLDIVKFAKENFLRNKSVTDVYVQHVNFMNFAKYGYTMPIYINTFRDPFNQSMSAYYYIRRSGDWRKFNYTKEERRQTFQECIQKSGRDCFKYNVIPLFCGHDSICFKRNGDAVAIAKQDVSKYYLVVGLMEDLKSFIAILERLFPQVFQGLDGIYESQLLMHKFYNVAEKDTSAFVIPSVEFKKEVIGKYLSYEYDLYKFIRHKYYIFKREIETLSCSKT